VSVELEKNCWKLYKTLTNQYNSLYWVSAWRWGLDCHAITTKSVGSGVHIAWRRGRFC